MLEATKSFTAADGSEIRANISRISEDHELAHLHPGAFKPATDGPPSRSVEPRRYSGTRAKVSEGGSRRSAATPSRRSRLPLEEELRVRRETLAKINREARDRNRETDPGGALLGTTESMLETPAKRQQRLREEREDLEAQENAEVIAQLARDEVSQVCRYWPDSAPWN